jgi:hypothetical protein
MKQAGAILPPGLSGHLPRLAHPILLFFQIKENTQKKEKERRAPLSYEARTPQYDTDTSTSLM